MVVVVVVGGGMGFEFSFVCQKWIDSMSIGLLSVARYMAVINVKLARYSGQGQPFV